jgi:hypothetical protein
VSTTQRVVIVFHIDKCIVGHRDYAFARVTVNVTEGTYLAHEQIPKASQFEKRTTGSVIDTFVGANEASVETPFATTRVHLTPAYQNLQLTLVESEDNTVN